jgi:hypothetical protein
MTLCARDLQDAPERAVLTVLTTCVSCAELTLQQQFPRPTDFVRSTDQPPTACIAAYLVLRSLANLRESLALYEAAVVAALHAEDCDELPF